MDDKTIIENIEKTLHDAILNIKPELTLSYKRMFGGAGYYADDKIFAAWFGNNNDTIALKLAAEDAETLLQIAGTKKAIMGGYVEIPAAWLQNADDLTPWVAKSLTHVASIPEKKKKTKK
jgi:DNA transformation protein and related proteins